MAEFRGTSSTVVLGRESLIQSFLSHEIVLEVKGNMQKLRGNKTYKPLIFVELSNKMWEAQFTCERIRNYSKHCSDFLCHMWLECKCFCPGKGSWGGGSSYREQSFLQRSSSSRLEGPEGYWNQQYRVNADVREEARWVSSAQSLLLRVFPMWGASALYQCL